MKGIIVSALMLIPSLAFAQNKVSLSLSPHPIMSSIGGSIEGTNKMSFNVGTLKLTPILMGGTIHSGDVGGFWTFTDEYVYGTIGVKYYTNKKFNMTLASGVNYNIRTNWTIDSPSWMTIYNVNYTIHEYKHGSFNIGVTTHLWNDKNLYLLPSLSYSHNL